MLLNVLLAILAMASGIFLLRFVAALFTDKLITASQLQIRATEMPSRGAGPSGCGFGGVGRSHDSDLGYEECSTLPVSCL